MQPVLSTTTPTAYCAAGCHRIVAAPGDMCMHCLAQSLGGYPVPEDMTQ